MRFLVVSHLNTRLLDFARRFMSMCPLNQLMDEGEEARVLAGFWVGNSSTNVSFKQLRTDYQNGKSVSLTPSESEYF
ncbi:MAG TPA: hypothetical protein DEP78_12700 [Verrucomicrobiales bacterium]|nr:hypothetical protein [Pedosphaera sp.]HBF02064.1 hypothetical protein [Verrucomicrobiales bacterium]HCB99117.1 hypothetical protein [Verrucomicrobiales bacterium]HCQ84735.1 hypothetical protein [Verrucomicrobiales bacterium]